MKLRDHFFLTQNPIAELDFNLKIFCAQNKKGCKTHLAVLYYSMQLTCTKCDQTKPHTDYYRNRASSTGRQSQCKACTYKPVVVRKTAPLDRTALCVDCAVNTRSQRYTVCLPCYNARRRANYTSTKRVLTASQLEERKQQRLARDRATYHRRRAANPELFKQRERERMRKRRQDPLRKLRSNIGTLIANKLSGQGYSKRSRTYSILGCSYQQFFAHIETQFAVGMGWHNRELWHLDHRVPCALALNEQELLLLNRWDNFQPLWAQDNQSKAASFDAHDPLYLELLDLRCKR